MDKLSQAVKSTYTKASLELLKQSIVLINTVNENYAEKLQKIYDDIEKDYRI